MPAGRPREKDPSSEALRLREYRARKAAERAGVKVDDVPRRTEARSAARRAAASSPPVRPPKLPAGAGTTAKLRATLEFALDRALLPEASAADMRSAVGAAKDAIAAYAAARATQGAAKEDPVRDRMVLDLKRALPPVCGACGAPVDYGQKGYQAAEDAVYGDSAASEGSGVAGTASGASGGAQ